MTPQDERGHELKYAIYVDAETYPEEDEAIEYVNIILRHLFKTEDSVTDGDGPL